jgi:hypothetical protein
MKAPLVPEAKPLLLCEEVVSDPNSGNVHLVGLFTAIRPQSQPPYPHRHPSFCVFVQLSDAVGELPSYLEIIEASSDEVIFRTATHQLVFPRRRFILRAIFRLRNCLFPRPGVYWIQLYCNGQFLTDYPLRLLEPGA